MMQSIVLSGVQTHHLPITDIFAIIANVAVIISLIQINHSAKSLKLQGLIEVMGKMKELSEHAAKVYDTSDWGVLVFGDFPERPPKRQKRWKPSEDYIRRINKRPELDTDSLAYKESILCINKLNDVCSLIENGIIKYEDFLSQYHTSVIRLISVIEPVRLHKEYLDKNSLGGNYGHRILRLYHQAINYNLMNSKHRAVSIYVHRRKDEQPICVIEGVKQDFFKNFYISVKHRVLFWKIKHFYI